MGVYFILIMEYTLFFYNKGGTKLKINDFIDFLKLPPNILAAISLVSGVILFAPRNFINKLYMIKFRDQFGFIIAIMFLISTAILIILSLIIIFKKVKSLIDSKKMRKARINYLLNADNYKVKLIKDFIKEETHTLQIQQNDGLTVELEHLGLISMAGNTQPVDFGYNNEMYLRYFLQPWVINLINNNEELKKKYKIK